MRDSARADSLGLEPKRERPRVCLLGLLGSGRASLATPSAPTEPSPLPILSYLFISPSPHRLSRALPGLQQRNRCIGGDEEEENLGAMLPASDSTSASA